LRLGHQIQLGQHGLYRAQQRRHLAHAKRADLELQLTDRQRLRRGGDQLLHWGQS
jgi:hypothetical protein